MATTGDVPSNIPMSGGQSIILTGTTAFGSVSIGYRQYSVDVSSPSSSMTRIFAYVNESVTVVSISAIISDGTNVVFNVEDRSAADTAGTDIMGTDLTATTSGTSVSLSPTYDLTVGHWLCVTITSVSGTVNNILIIVSTELR